MRFGKPLAATVAVLAALGAASAAQAQRGGHPGGVVVIDSQRVLSDSTVGRDLQAKLNPILAQIQQEAAPLQTERQSLEQEAQRLARATNGMTQAQVQANATLGPQVTSFNTRRQQFEQRANALQGDADCTQALSIRDFNNQVQPTVRAVMQQQGAGVVLEARAVVLMDPGADITQAVIDRLNQSVRTATVTRHHVNECQAQQAGH